MLKEWLVQFAHWILEKYEPKEPATSDPYEVFFVPEQVKALLAPARSLVRKMEQTNKSASIGYKREHTYNQLAGLHPHLSGWDCGMALELAVYIERQSGGYLSESSPLSSSSAAS